MVDQNDQIALALGVLHTLQHNLGHQVQGGNFAPRRLNRLLLKKPQPGQVFDHRTLPVNSELSGYVGLDIPGLGHPRGQEAAHELGIGPARHVAGPIIQKAQRRDFVQHIAPALVAQRASIHRRRIVNTVDLAIGYGVAVGVSFKLAQTLYIQQPVMGKQLLAGHVDLLALAQIMGRVARRQQHPARTPGEFVAKGVVVGLRSGQTAAVGHKTVHMPAGSLHLVDDLHGRHVVNAGVHPYLVEDDDAGRFGRRVQFAHSRADVRGCDHVFTLGNARFGQRGMVDVRQHTDRQIGLVDQSG